MTSGARKRTAAPPPARTWGANLAAAKLARGAVLVFELAGGGHVGFYVGEDLTSYHVLGGNQGKRVSVMRLEKSRCIRRRWLLGRPVIGKPVMMKAIGGVPLSANEC